MDNLAGNAEPIEIIDEEPEPSLLPPVPISWREPAAHIEASDASAPPQATPAASSAAYDGCYAVVAASLNNNYRADSPMLVPPSHASCQTCRAKVSNVKSVRAFFSKMGRKKFFGSRSRPKLATLGFCDRFAANRQLRSVGPFMAVLQKSRASKPVVSM